MALDIDQANEAGLVHARISGLMTPADQRALDSLARRMIDAGQTISLLVTLEDFEGWTKDPAWADDLGVQATHGHDIARIAIVGDPRWRDEAFLYVGKGFRRTGVAFYPAQDVDAARAWLLR